MQQLAVHTEGGVVTPAQALMSIVPADSHLEIEAMISNKDIGFVHEGEEAEIKIDTFDFTRYGLIHGKVLSSRRMPSLRKSPRMQGAPITAGAWAGLYRTQASPRARSLSMWPISRSAAPPCRSRAGW